MMTVFGIIAVVEGFSATLAVGRSNGPVLRKK
jgi:hypothetical protein